MKIMRVDDQLLDLTTPEKIILNAKDKLAPKQKEAKRALHDISKYETEMKPIPKYTYNTFEKKTAKSVMKRSTSNNAENSEQLKKTFPARSRSVHDDQQLLLSPKPKAKDIRSREATTEERIEEIKAIVAEQQQENSKTRVYSR